MTPARCAECQAVIDRLRGQGYTYSARQQDNDPWEVSFMGKRTRRARGTTLHDAIQTAQSELSVRQESRVEEG